MAYKIKLYNSLSNSLETFKPIEDNRITMYVCGPTVYDYIHIGNSRPVVVFDVLFRLLQFAYTDSEIVYVNNITDIDDKIINKARETNKTPEEIATINTKYFIDDLEKLSVLTPTHRPKATEYIQQMQTFISGLVAKQYAYLANNNTVYFNVAKASNYGSLSKNKSESVIAGARVALEPNKINPSDFVLWKPSLPNEIGWHFKEINVYGRPGWHTECAAMINTILGPQIDIHAGGKDLLFPHHENENAQSCCLNNTTTMANYWLHNGFVTVEGQKMSKSLGNFILLNALLKKYDANVIKLALFSTHYRQNMDVSNDLFAISQKTYAKFTNAFNAFNIIPNQKAYLKANEDFINALCTDLNTPAAISILHTLIKQNTHQSLGEFVFASNLLGITYNAKIADYENYAMSKMDINAKIIERDNAKLNKNYHLADTIRLELLNNGIVLTDTAHGTTWKVTNE